MDLIQYYKHNLLRTELFNQLIDRVIPQNSPKPHYTKVWVRMLVTHKNTVVDP
jgi:hypothetical protein